MKSICSLLLVVFGTIIVYVGCKKEATVKPDPPYNGPAMQARSAAIYPDGGVTLIGTIHQIPTDLKSYGFMIAGDSLMSTNILFIKASAPAALGDFQVNVNAGLVKGKKYYYTPFYSIYDGPNQLGMYLAFAIYNIKTFNSDGSKSVKVDSLYPMKADMGDTITIKGKYFLNQGLNVITGGQFGYLSVSDTVIRFIVPYSLTTTTPIIILQYSGGHTDTVGKGFRLNAPTIKSFTNIATFRDTITVSGDHFGPVNSLNEVDFGGVKGTVLTSSRRQLTVVVPDNVTTLNSVLTVRAQLQVVNSSAPFRIRRPVITSVTPTANITNLITVTGKYFHPMTGFDALYFENINTQPNSGSTTQLQANLPQGPFPRRKVSVALKFMDTTFTWSQDIQLKDKWVWVSASIPFSAESAIGSFSINNTSYVVAPILVGLGPQINYLWKFNPADFSWQKMDIPVAFGNGIVTATATKAYLYTTDITNNFWEYDPPSNTWTKIATYLAGRRYSGTMFAVGAKIYLGLGQAPGFAGGNNPPNNTLYQYDIATNTWTQKTSYPADPYIEVINATAMVFGNKVVVFGDANIQNYNKIYSYDATADSWKVQGDFNSNTNSKNAFVYNDYGFIAGMVSYSFTASDYRSCFKYNSSTDTWAILPEDIGQVAGLGNLQAGFTFINNGIVYVGGNDGPYSQLYSTSVVGL
jgi:hypothetical protein